MTKIEALKVALSTMNDTDAMGVIAKMIQQLETRKEVSAEQKQKNAERAKARNAEKRNALVAEIMPKLFAVMGTDEDSAQTARSIFESAELPADMTVGKIQAMLLKNADVVVIDNGRNAKTYFRKLA